MKSESSSPIMRGSCGITGAELERFARMTILENLFCGCGFTSFFLLAAVIFASEAFAFLVSFATLSFSLRRLSLASCFCLRSAFVSAESQAGEWQMEEVSESSSSVLMDRLAWF